MYTAKQCFNRLFISGQYPQAWKYANVTLVYKKGDKQLPNNYRPISLLSVIGKTIERSVHKYVYNYCTQHKSNRKAMNRNWRNQRQTPLLKPKREINKYYK